MSYGYHEQEKLVYTNKEEHIKNVEEALEENFNVTSKEKYAVLANAVLFLLKTNV